MKRLPFDVLVLLLGMILAGCGLLPVTGVESQPTAAAATSMNTKPVVANKPAPAHGTQTPVPPPPKAQPTSGLSLAATSEANVQVPVPTIEGLGLKLGTQPGTAEYLDSKGRTLLLVDVIPLKNDNPHDSQLKNLLDQVYGPSSPYVQASVYPRFHYPLDGVKAGFFAIDVSLTGSQVLLLRDALELFSRPAFASMQPELFPPDNAYLTIDKIGGNTAGLTYSGTGVVELDRRDLFGNKYLLASVIAHEGSHVLQGPQPANATCADSLKREIGDQTIPDGFYQWDATTLLQAIKDGKIGAYHVSLWMLVKLGIKDVGWVQQAIKTGMVDGGSVVDCKL
jgi:hypothetical protein